MTSLKFCLCLTLQRHQQKINTFVVLKELVPNILLKNTITQCPILVTVKTKTSRFLTNPHSNVSSWKTFAKIFQKKHNVFAVKFFALSIIMVTMSVVASVVSLNFHHTNAANANEMPHYVSAYINVGRN